MRSQTRASGKNPGAVYKSRGYSTPTVPDLSFRYILPTQKAIVANYSKALTTKVV